MREAILDNFINAVTSTGITAPENITADGTIHRFSSNGKPGDKAGYYVLYANSDGSFAGKFGCWRSLESTFWSSKSGSRLSLSDKLQMEENRRNAHLEIEKKHCKRASFAKSIIGAAKPATSSHAYIQKKGGLPVDGVFELASIPCSLFFDNPENQKVMRNLLLVPVSDKDGQLLTLQAISESGEKSFLSGGKTKGGMFTFNGNSEQIYVAEGFATAASIHAATGNTVVCAFNANNLKLVAPQVQELNPDSLVIVAADNDHKNELSGKGNKGKEVALELFSSEKLPYSCPEFEEDAGTDWNDYALKHGIEQLKSAIYKNLVKPKPEFSTFEEALEQLREDTNDVDAYKAAVNYLNKAELLFQSRMKQELKKVTGVPIKDLNQSMREIKALDQPEQMSHGDIARQLIKNHSKTQLVAAYGSVWTYEENTGLWVSQRLSDLGNIISTQFNVQDKCQRVSDYKGIASFVYDLQEEQEFFDNATYGITTPSGFLCVGKHSVEVMQFNALQRSRHSVSFDPAPKGSQPLMFLRVLDDAFEGCYPKEQIRQLQMLFGASVFGLMPKHQLAVLLYGAGGSGKSLVLKVLENLLPPEAIATVSPMQMDQDYKVATLAGKRFNLVPELDKDIQIPSAAFKSIIGGDTVNAREPYGKSFNFTPNVTNWFNGNFFPKTTDQSEGFYRRWSIIHFKNTKPASQRDPYLLDKIVANELPAVLAWAIEGVEDYLQQSVLTLQMENEIHQLYFSPAHYEYLSKWKSEMDSVKGWLSDTNENGILAREFGSSTAPLKLADAFSIYKNWCLQVGYRPYCKSDFKHNMELCGYIASKPQGILTFNDLMAHTPLISGVSVTKWQ